MKSGAHIAYLGPEGTFSHLVAKKRIGASAKLFPQASVFDVFDFVRGGKNRLGIVPIENSSGGTIYETVDCLVDEASGVSILEDLSLNVRLALMGRRDAKIETIYSHFVPMRHCEPWLRKNYPDAKRVPVASTAKAAEMAAAENISAALGTRDAAKRNGLDVLEFPIRSDVPNITQFYCVGRPPRAVQPRSARTTIVVTLKNEPNSLCLFLEKFGGENVNLTRLLSRPIIGQHKAYLFVLDIEGTPAQPRIGNVLAAARAKCESLRVLGVYPVRAMYES